MINVFLTANLGKYFPQSQLQLQASNLDQLLSQMDQMRPNFLSYILEDNGEVRTHVNIFVNGNVIQKNAVKQTQLTDNDEVHIMQALSGG